MKPIKFKNAGEKAVRLVNLLGHMCILQPGETREVPGILRAEALAANLSCQDKELLASMTAELAGSEVKTAAQTKAAKAAAAKAAKAAAAVEAAGESSAAVLDNQD